MRLVNVGNDYLQKDFVAAESVRVVVRCDRQILHRASGILAEFNMIAVTGATKSSQAPSTVYLRVCDRVADKKDLAKKWAEALTAGAQKQQPLGNRYDGEDVSAKNPLTKALAARGLSFAKAS